MSTGRPTEDSGGEEARGKTSEGRGKSILRGAPSWLVSLVLHLLVLLVATLFYVENYVLEPEGAYVTSIRRAEPQKIMELDRPEPKKPPAEDKPSEEADASLLSEEEPQPADASDSSQGDAQDTGGIGDGGLGAANVYDAIGIGGGGGTRPARHVRPAAEKKKRAPLDKGIKAALAWLARHQSADGSWSVTRFSKDCGRHGFKEDCARAEFEGNEQFDEGVTGLAVLALLGAGYLPWNREPVHAPSSGESGDLSEILGEAGQLTYGEVVKRALRHLIAAQTPGGRIGPEVDRYIYNHMIGALALCEAYGMTRIWLLRAPAERAVQFIVDARTPGMGWRYLPRSGDTDASVTGWAVTVLKSAESAGLSFDRSVYADVRKWYEAATTSAGVARKVTGDRDWDETRTFTLTGYLGAKDAGSLVSVGGLNEHYHYTPSQTAVMMMCLEMMDGSSGQLGEKGIDTLFAFLPAKWTIEDRASWRKVDFYYWYHATYALFQTLSSDDPRWKRWGEALRPALAEMQNLKGFEGHCLEGSWEPIDRWSCEGGRVYATALGALTLEVLYRYPRVLALDKKALAVKIGD